MSSVRSCLADASTSELSRTFATSEGILADIPSVKTLDNSKDDIDQSVRFIKRRLAEKLSGKVGMSGVQLTEMLQEVLQSMRDKGDRNNIQIGLELLNVVEKSSYKLRDKSLLPDDYVYTMAAQLLGLNPQEEETCRRVDDLINRLLKTGRIGNMYFWSACLHVLSKASPFHGDAADRAEELLQRMKDLGMQPDEHCIGPVLHAVATSGQRGAPQRAQTILERSMSESSTVRTNEECYNICVDAWAKRGGLEGAQKAAGLAEEMLARSKRGQGPPPSTVTYTAVINAWANSGHAQAGSKAESVLQRMIGLSEEVNTQPDTETYSAVIDAWSKSRQSAAAPRATELLHQMEKAHARGDTNINPSIVTYTSVIHAWANSRNRDAPFKAEEILAHMEKLARCGREDLTPNTVAYTAVLNAWSKSRLPDAPNRALELLREMQESGLANFVSFNAVIAAFAQRGEADKAVRLLQEMKEWERRGHDNLAPTTTSYASVFNALARSDEDDAADMARHLLKEMEQEYRAGKERLKPNSVVYTSMLSVLAEERSTAAAQEAESLLERVHAEGKTKLNALTLSSVLKAWFLSRDPEAPERISALLDWGRRESVLGGASQEHRICMNYLVGAWSRSGRTDAHKRIMGIVDEMKENRALPNPDVHSYNHLMGVMRHPLVSNPANERFRVLALLIESQDRDRNLAPNVRSFHLVLDAFKRFRGTEVERAMATSSLNEVAKMIKSAKGWSPNPTTFQLFFEACFVLDGMDQEIVDEIYQICKDRGLLKRSVKSAYSSLSGPSKLQK